jgi:hypothetical protein
MNLVVNDVLNIAFKGKKLLDLEFGANEVGCRDVNFGLEITHVSLSVDEDRDPIIKFTLSDGSEADVYDNEEITVSEAD